MDFVAVGYPGYLAAWGFQFLEAALRRLAPGLPVLHLDRFDVPEDIGRHPGARLILSLFPNPEFARTCEERHIPAVVFVDDVFEAVQHVRRQHGISTVEALRPVTAGMVLAGRIARAPQSLMIGRDTADATPRLLAALAAFLGLDVSNEHVQKMCRQLGAEGLALETALRRQSAGASASAELTDDDKDMIVQVLGGLREHLVQPTPGDVTWPRQCFLVGDRPDASAPVALEVTGRARIIYYGPYFHLPRGMWKVRMSVGFSQDIRGMPFSIDVYSTDLLGRARIFADRGGIFSVEFEAVVTASHEPIEVRIMNEQGAIEGHMGLVGIDFTHWRPHPDDLQARLPPSSTQEHGLPSARLPASALQG